MLQKTKIKSISARLTNLLKIAAASWGVICIILFILFPGRVSMLHGSLLDNVVLLPPKLESVDFIKFIADLLSSFFKILIVTFIYIFTGAALVPSAQNTKENQNQTSPLSFAITAGSAFLLGHLVFSIIFFSLAYFKGLTPFAVVFVLLAGLLFGLPKGYKYFVSPLKNRDVDFSIMHGDLGYRIVNLLSLVMLFTTLLLAASRLSYDSVYLYFSDPKATALTSSLHFFQGNIFVISSFQTVIHFAAIISIFGDQTARMYSWISGCLMIIFGLGIAGKVGLSNKAKSIFVAMMLSTTAITDLLGDGKVDLTSTAIVMASIYWMLNDNDRYNKFVAGIFAGLAMSSRPYNIFLLGLFTLIFYLIRAYREINNPRARQNFIGSIFLISLGAVVPILLNLLANWAVLGSPFAMFSDANGLPADKWQWAFDPKYIWVIRLLLPFTATFLNTPQSLGGLSPIFLGFLPILFFGNLRKKLNFLQPLGDLLTATIITLVLWICLFFTIMEIRYVFFLWIFLYMPVSEAVVFVIENKGFPLQKALSSLVGILLVFGIVRTVYISLDTYSPIDAKGTPQCQEIIFCDYLKSINGEAPEGTRVLTLNAFRYYLRNDLLTCSTAGDEYWALRDASLQSADAFWEEVYRQGYSYIAYENNYSVRHLYIEFEPAPKNVPSWMKIIPIYGTPGDPAVAYRILVNDPPITREKNCKPNLNNVFEVQPVQ